MTCEPCPQNVTLYVPALTALVITVPFWAKTTLKVPDAVLVVAEKLSTVMVPDPLTLDA
jgi:hypothetical protein